MRPIPRPLYPQIKGFPSLLRRAFSQWRRDSASLLAAGLAYYGLFSLAPVLIIIIGLTDYLLGYRAIETYILEGLLAIWIGPEAAGALQMAIDRTRNSETSLRITALGITFLLFSAVGLFVQTRRALNIIWCDRWGACGSVRSAVRSYLLSFALIFVVGFMLLAASFVTAVLLPVSVYLEGHLPLGLGTLHPLNIAISTLITAALFAVTYKTFSESEISWGDVLLGSSIAAVLASIGNLLLGLYASVVHIGSIYGATGSLFVLLLWIYYSAQIFLFGAEVIKVYRMDRVMDKVAKAG